MRRKPEVLLLVAGQFFLAALAWGQGAYKAVPSGPVAAPEIPNTVEVSLETQGLLFENPQGTPLCEIWWRKGIPSTSVAPSSSGDVLYSGLSMGEFVGLIRFSQTTKDYRGQSIKPGYYALRYALIPQDGNHMGVSSYRDFLLLIPVADDPGPVQTMTFDQVVKASRLTAGTGHPAVMMLAPVSRNSKFPSAVEDDQGDWMLDVKLNTSGGLLPFAIVLVGQYQG